jgi:hypothetical protein
VGTKIQTDLKQALFSRFSKRNASQQASTTPEVEQNLEEDEAPPVNLFNLVSEEEAKTIQNIANNLLKNQEL